MLALVAYICCATDLMFDRHRMAVAGSQSISAFEAAVASASNSKLARMRTCAADVASDHGSSTLTHLCGGQRAGRTSAQHEQAPAELAGQAILSIVLCAVYGGSVRAEPRCHHGRLARAVEVLRPLRALVRLALAGDVAPAHQAGCNMNAFARSCGTRRCSRTGKTQQGGRARAENGRPHLMKGSSRPVAFHAMARSKSVARNKDSKIATYIL